MEAIKNAIHDLPQNKPVFIVVPDRQTLQIEEMLFDELNLSSTFLINVVGLTNLAIKYAGVELEPISEVEGLMYVKKAVENVKQNFKYFKSTNINFCQEVFKFISQLSSSAILPQEISCSCETALQKKVADIKLIYQEYLNLTSNKTDPNQLLQEFENVVVNHNLFDDAYFYFVGFDNFTLRHYQLILALAKKCQCVAVGVPMPVSKKNAYIYDGDIISKIKELAKSVNQTVKIISPPSALQDQPLQIASQLFGGEKQAVEASNVHIFEARSARQEADWAAKLIAFEVFNGARYKHFAVAVSDMAKYGEVIATAFEKNNIPYYLDCSISASQTYLALVFKKLISFAYKNFSRQDLLFLINCPLFDYSAEQISQISQTYQGGKQFFALKDVQEIKDIAEAVSKNPLDGARAALKFMRENLEKYLSLIDDEKTLNMENQVADIIESIIEACEQVGVISLKEFISAVDLALEATQVSAIPSYVDQVYVGDATDSFFSESQVLIVVGANASCMPKITQDNSLFSDDELKRENFVKKVEPTVKTINRRARFKIFSLLSSWKKRLYVSYSLSGDDDKPISPSLVVGELKELFNKHDKIITNILPDELQDINQLLLAIGRNRVGAEEVMAQTSSQQIKQTLDAVLKPNLQKFNTIKPLSSAQQLKLGQTIKPTEIEKFYDCPFKVYCENVLKLKEKRLQALSPADVGSIVHDVLEDYGKTYKFQPLDETQLKQFINKKLNSAYDFSMLVDGDLVLAKLEKDLFKVCQAVSQENAQSKYQPWLMEQKIQIDLQGKPLVGRVDRADKTGDVFRIIDYKTGKISNNLVKQLSYGKRLQLFVYADAICQKYNLKCGGIYYFDAKAGYTGDNKILVGLTSEDDVDGQSSKTISAQQMQQLQNQAQQMLLKGAKLLSEGKLLPYPDAGSCEYCKYKAICRYDRENGVRRMKGGGE